MKLIWSDVDLKRLYIAERAAYLYYWKWLYYKDVAVIDDQTFDLHYRNQLFYEATYPELITYTPLLGDMVGIPNHCSVVECKLAIRAIFGVELSIS